MPWFPAADPPGPYPVAMAKATAAGPRWDDTRRRDEHARRQSLRRAGRRPVGRNIEEGARLAATVGKFSAGFDAYQFNAHQGDSAA